MLTDYLNQLLSSPLLLGIAIILIIFCIFHLLKKVFKIAVFLSAIILILGIYLVFNSKEPVKEIETIWKNGNKQITQLKDQALQVSEVIDQNLENDDYQKVFDKLLENNSINSDDALKKLFEEYSMNPDAPQSQQELFKKLKLDFKQFKQTDYTNK